MQILGGEQKRRGEGGEREGRERGKREREEEREEESQEEREMRDLFFLVRRVWRDHSLPLISMLLGTLQYLLFYIIFS